jgi:hypothetical protein
MVRLSTFVGLALALLALSTPVQAAAPVIHVVQAPNPCVIGGLPATGPGFSPGAISCYQGGQLGSYAAIPGWAFTRSTAETCYWASGATATVGANVPCVTDLGLQSYVTSTNDFLNSATGATQTVTTTAASWTLSFYGTGSIAGTGTCTISLAGTGANNRVSSTTTETAGACVLTVTGTVTDVQFEPLGVATPYIATGGSPVTRDGDNAVITGLVAPNAYTILAKGNSAYISAFPSTVNLNIASSTNNEAYISTTSSGFSGQAATSSLRIGGSTIGGTSIQGFNPPGQTIKLAMGVNSVQENFGAAGKVGPITAGGVLAWTRMGLGIRANNANQISGYVQYGYVLAGLTNAAPLSAGP